MEGGRCVLLNSECSGSPLRLERTVCRDRLSETGETVAVGGFDDQAGSGHGGGSDTEPDGQPGPNRGVSLAPIPATIELPSDVPAERRMPSGYVIFMAGDTIGTDASIVHARPGTDALDRRERLWPVRSPSLSITSLMSGSRSRPVETTSSSDPAHTMPSCVGQDQGMRQFIATRCPNRDMLFHCMGRRIAQSICSESDGWSRHP
jgi:hypothetical protein